MKVSLSKSNFPHIKLTNPSNFVVLVNYSWSFPLSFGKDDVDEVLKFIEIRGI